MQRFHIRASLYGVEPERLHQLLKAFLGELSFRSRLMGYQMFHDQPRFQLSVETMDHVRQPYVLDGRYQGDASEVEAWVKRLCERLDDADILYLLDYVEMDDNGLDAGEELSFSAAEFDKRYDEWRNRA